MNDISTITTADERRTPTTVAMGLKPQLAETLPKYIDPDAFARTIQTAIQIQPELLNCSPRSLMIACMKAAADGLILDGREAALIVRSVNVGSRDAPKWEKHATYQPMVQGLMKLARNSGDISSIVAHVVYSNDKFHYVLGDDERIEHEPAPFDTEQGAPIAVYSIVKLKDGTVIREVMRKSAVLNIAAQGKNPDQYDPNKGKNFAEWWRKTVLRRITKFLPRSSDAIGRFAQAAERVDDDFEFDDERPVHPATQLAGKRRGGAAAALKDITPTSPIAPTGETETPIQQPAQKPAASTTQAQAAKPKPETIVPADGGGYVDARTGEFIDDPTPQPGDEI